MYTVSVSKVEVISDNCWLKHQHIEFIKLHFATLTLEGSRGDWKLPAAAAVLEPARIARVTWTNSALVLLQRTEPSSSVAADGKFGHHATMASASVWAQKSCGSRASADQRRAKCPSHTCVQVASGTRAVRHEEASVYLRTWSFQLNKDTSLHSHREGRTNGDLFEMVTNGWDKNIFFVWRC